MLPEFFGKLGAQTIIYHGLQPPVNLPRGRGRGQGWGLGEGTITDSQKTNGPRRTDVTIAGG